MTEPVTKDDLWGELGASPSDKERDDRTLDQQARDNFWRSLDEDADARARMARNAQALGTAPVLGKEAETRLQRLADAKTAQETINANKGLQGWFSNLHRATISHDDVEGLAGIEKAAGFLTLDDLRRGWNTLTRRPDAVNTAVRANMGNAGVGPDAGRGAAARVGAIGRQVNNSWTASQLDAKAARLETRRAAAVVGAGDWTEADQRELDDARTEAALRRLGGLQKVPDTLVGVLNSGASGIVSGGVGMVRGPVDAGTNVAENAIAASNPFWKYGRFAPYAAMSGMPKAEAVAPRTSPVMAGLMKMAGATPDQSLAASALLSAASADPRVGFLRGSAEFTAEQEAGGAFQQYRQVQTLDGRPLNEKYAAEAAMLVGAINAGLEFGTGALIGGAWGSTRELRDKLLAQGGQAAVRRFALGEIVKKYGLRVLATGAGEGTEEVVQAASTQTFEEFAKLKDGGEFAPTDWSAFAASALEQGAYGFAGGLMFGLPVMGVELRADLQARDAALATRDRVLALADAAKKARLTTRDPDAAAAFIDDHAAPGAPPILIDVQGMMTLAQEARQSPEEFAQSLGIAPERYRAAVEGDGVIEVSAGHYATRIALTAHGPKLADHISMDRSQPTPAQAEAAVKEAEAQVAAVQKAAEEESRTLVEKAKAHPDYEVLRKEVEGILTAGGAGDRGAVKMQAELIAANMAANADKLDPETYPIGRGDMVSVGGSAERLSETPAPEPRRVREIITTADGERQALLEGSSVPVPVEQLTREGPVSPIAVFSRFNLRVESYKDREAAATAEADFFARMGAATPASGVTMNQFAGVRAKTANRGALADAQQRIASGEDAEVVRRETGWFQGDDGSWKFEIDDSKARFTKMPKKPGFHGDELGFEGPLGRILDHPDLFRAYPSLYKFPVRIEITHEPMMSHFSSTGLNVEGETQEEAMAILMHEIQHYIQDVEKWEGGANPAAAEPMRENWYNAIVKLMEDLQAEGRGHNMIPELDWLLTKIAEFNPGDNNSFFGGPSGFAVRGYETTIGETEARNTQARLRMTKKQRNETPPDVTRDVPRGATVTREFPFIMREGAEQELEDAVKKASAAIGLPWTKNAQDRGLTGERILGMITQGGFGGARGYNTFVARDAAQKLARGTHDWGGPLDDWDIKHLEKDLQDSTQILQVLDAVEATGVQNRLFADASAFGLVSDLEVEGYRRQVDEKGRPLKRADDGMEPASYRIATSPAPTPLQIAEALREAARCAAEMSAAAAAGGTAAFMAGNAIAATAALPAGIAVSAATAAQNEAEAQRRAEEERIARARAEAEARAAEEKRKATLKRDNFAGYLSELPSIDAMYPEVAKELGVPEQYLRDLVQHESGGDFAADAPTSSAFGAGQFINDAWKTETALMDGRYGPEPWAGQEQRDMDMERAQPNWMLLAIAQRARRDAVGLRNAIGRTPTQGEVYLAHFLGPKAAVDLIEAADRGVKNAAAHFKDAAKANRSVFYEGGDLRRPRTAAGVRDKQTEGFSSEKFTIGATRFEDTP
ncbi:MAG: hypothetical protein EBR82_07995 [Caulobacteraceae bacterium]|nr:hypothetical protein [Caulobacteraceae bacterium]